jgi:hypothetical protein
MTDQFEEIILEISACCMRQLSRERLYSNGVRNVGHGPIPPDARMRLSLAVFTPDRRKSGMAFLVRRAHGKWTENHAAMLT